MPPSMQPEVSPTVSTAVTMNMMQTGMMAAISKVGFTGSRAGTENQAASAILLQFRTQALVYSTPSALTAVWGRHSPMTAQRM